MAPHFETEKPQTNQQTRLLPVAPLPRDISTNFGARPAQRSAEVCARRAVFIRDFPALSSAAENIWSRIDWRRETNRNPKFSVLWKTNGPAR